MSDQPTNSTERSAAAEAQSRWHVPWQLLLLALPIIASMISRTVMSFVDFVMVSQLGTEAQAAIVPAGILLFCVISFGVGMLTMVNTFVSQSLGRNDLLACGQYLWQGLWLAGALWLVILPGWFITPDLFRFVGHDPNVQAMESIYVRIGLFGIGPTLMSTAIVSFFNGIHRPMVGLYVAVAGNVFNVVANYALIFGHFGLPPMGIAGAALGTALAALLELIILLVWIQRPAFADTYGSSSQWRIHLDKMKQIIWHGTAAGAHFTFDVGTWLIFTMFLVGRFGTVQLAAHNLSFKLLEISFMPVFGLSMALTAAVGKAIGQNDPELARSKTRWATLFGMGWMGTMALLYVTVGHRLAGLLTDDAEVVHWASRILLLCALFQLFDALILINLGALRGAADVHWPALVGTSMMLTIFLTGGYLATRYAPQWGALGPWATATIYCTCLGSALYLRWRFGPWEKRMHDHPVPPQAAMAD